jgi:hypothetical protein
MDFAVSRRDAAKSARRRKKSLFAQDFINFFKLGVL